MEVFISPTRHGPRTGEIVKFTALGGWYSVKGAADKLGVEYFCLDTWLKRGKVRFARIGNERLVKLEEVAAYRDKRAAARATTQQG